MHSPSTHLHVHVQHDDAAKHLGGVVPGQLHVLCHILLPDVLSKLGLQAGSCSKSFREAAQQGTCCTECANLCDVLLAGMCMNSVRWQLSSINQSVGHSGFSCLHSASWPTDCGTPSLSYMSEGRL